MFEHSLFENGCVAFRINAAPLSVNSNTGDRRIFFQQQVRDVVSRSKYVVSGMCHVAIQYRCNLIHKIKNPGAYDIDNIIKPIIDNITGREGILVDDAFMSGVHIDWQDSCGENEHLDIELEFLPPHYERRDDLILLKSPSGWCLPVSKNGLGSERYIEYLCTYFSKWDTITSEKDYYDHIHELGALNFIYHNKVKNSGFEIIELLSLT